MSQSYRNYHAILAKKTHTHPHQ